VEKVVASKRIEENSFKIRKLSKTRQRRRALEHDQRLASEANHSRNDLLPKLEVRQVSVDALKASSHRARVTSPEQLERVTRSISRLGFNDPILAAAGEIIDGEVRWEAARKLGLETVPVIDCAHLTETEVRELRLALGRIAEQGEWDLDRLKIEFEELIDLGVDLDVTGFSAEDRDIILLDAEPQPESDDGSEIEAPAVPVTQTGDIWELASHRVACGDSRELEIVQALMAGEQGHAVLSDAPYNVKIQGNVSGLGKKVHDEFAFASGELSDEEWQEFLNTSVQRMVAVLVAGAVLFLFMDWRSIHRLYAAGFASNLKLINLAIWYKQSGGMGALYRSAHELIAVFCKGEKPHTNNVELGRHGRDRTNVWVAPGANRRGSSANAMLQFHATPKPTSLCADAILDVTSRGQIVIDFFLGSGTTLVAAEETGRRCFGIEFEPKFVDLSVTRWMRLTGDQAVLAATGETFEQVAARRLDEQHCGDRDAPISEGDQDVAGHRDVG
jgi:DNA modification methylase